MTERGHEQYAGQPTGGSRRLWRRLRIRLSTRGAPQRSLLRAAVLAGATMLIAPGYATTPNEDFAARLDRLSPVTKVAGIEEIGSIQVLDAHRLSFQVNRAARYLVTFTPACTLLPYAQHISMSYDRGTLYAGFDSVEADGQACRINAIFRL